ncbi:WG repeat-containing protein [Moraxella sp. FZLJ2107]|uniref:WG repeat-containing protein n=1 Tax=unclassified Moraxella TaxID=2685852 RepID=UPI0020C8A4CB|nr:MULTISPECIES: WG repeat-containing protein [unclassified Moraxella]UTO05091.1 WG repeat-containing protein [Moraxella sp. FZLJ2107]UTO21826.1 WG repeat-containing protein [Moraxella sp. FZLJ2109]
MKLAMLGKVSCLAMAMLLVACGNQSEMNASEQTTKVDDATDQLIASFTRTSSSNPDCKVPDLPYDEINCVYDDTGLSFVKGLYNAIKYDTSQQVVQHELINPKGEVIVDILGYEAVDMIASEGLIAVMQDEKVGYIDLSGRTVIPLMYDSTQDPENKYSEQWAYPANKHGIVVKKDGKFGVISRDNQVLIPFEYDHLTNFSEEGILLYHYYDDNLDDIYNTGSWGMIDTNGNGMDLSHFTDTLANFTGYDGFNEGLLAVSDNVGQWGFVDKAGKQVILPQYQEVRSFSEGMAGVMKDGVWGFIDKNGNAVIDFQYPDETVPRYSVNMMGMMMFTFRDGKAEVSTAIPDEVACIDHQAKLVPCE